LPTHTHTHTDSCRFIHSAISAALLVVGTSAWAAPPAPPQSHCKQTLKITHSASMLQELRGLGLSADDFPKRFEARTVDPTRHRPLRSGGTGPEGKALFWVGPSGPPFADSSVFGTLTTASVTQMGAGSIQQVGLLKASMAHRELIVQLIEAGVILTYAHLGSELCLGQGDAEIHITGSHSYMTNTDNTDPLDFVVRIDSAGLISVRTPAHGLH
jgi:hypothetical protein